MRVFVTGASGFIGSHLCARLVDDGHEVLALVRDPKSWRLSPIADKITFVTGSLGNHEAWADKLVRLKPDAIAHLGWQGVGGSARNDFDQIANLQWSAELVRLSERAGARRFVGLGSQAEYGPKHDVISPDDVADPTTLYGELKLATCRVSRRLCEIYGMEFVWMRVFSTYGPTDHPYWMIPGLIRALLKGERPALTDGDQKWDFLHVKDAARAIAAAITKEGSSGIYNLGSGSAPSLRSTIECVRDAIRPGAELGFGDIPYREDQVMILQADTSSLTSDFGWRPQIRLSDGIQETARWYSDNQWIFESADR